LGQGVMFVSYQAGMLAFSGESRILPQGMLAKKFILQFGKSIFAIR
jgi:hypothetical protein